MSSITLSGKNLDLGNGNIKVNVQSWANFPVRIMSINQQPTISHAATGQTFDVTISVANDFTTPLPGGVVTSVKAELFNNGGSIGGPDLMTLSGGTYSKTFNGIAGSQTVHGKVYVEWQIITVDDRDSPNDTLP